MPRRTPRLCRAGVAAALLVLTAAVPARAEPVVEGEWTFSGLTAGTDLEPGEAFGDPSLWTGRRRTDLRAVAGPRGTVLDVDAWRDLAVGEKVDPTSTTLSSDPDFDAGTPWGLDGGTSTFDPGTEDFSVSVWVRPTLASQFPRGSKRPRAISPNIVQKGRSNAVGGYWKLTLVMVRTDAGLRWAPECVFKAGDGTTSLVNRGGKGIVLDDGAGVRLTCRRTGSRHVITVTDDAGVTWSVSKSIGVLDVDNDSALSVGNKVGSRSATDAYDGLLGDVVVVKG